MFEFGPYSPSPPTRWYWAPSLGWLVLHGPRVRRSHRQDPKLPEVVLILCFSFPEWEPLFVQEDCLTLSTYAPGRLNNNVAPPPNWETSLQAVKASYERGQAVMHEAIVTL